MTFVKDPTALRMARRLISKVMPFILLEFDLSPGTRVELVSDTQPLAGGVISHSVVCMFLSSYMGFLETLDLRSVCPQLCAPRG